MPRRRRNPGYSGASPNSLTAAGTFDRGLTRQRLNDTITASGARIDRRTAEAMIRLRQPWQTRSFAYYDLLGEIWFAAQFYARMLSPLRLYPAVMDDQGKLTETEDAEAVAQLARIQDPGGGGRADLLASYGRIMFLAGEAILFATKDPDTDMEQWEMLSTEELRVLGPNEFQRIQAPSLPTQEFRAPSEDDYEPVDDDSAVAYRLWRRHPRYSQFPDSTMRGILDLCEELILLTQAVRARARSRTAGAGLLLIDTRVSGPAPPEPEGDEDPLEDPFLADLIEAMISPIADEGSASAVVPHLVRVSGIEPGMSVKDMIYHLQLVDPTQLYPEVGLRMELIKRMAIGLDLPPEVLLGLSDANHWTAWTIDEQTWKGHGQPLANSLVGDLTAAFYRPSLKQAGVKDWAKYQIAYDPSAVINHPDRTKDAKDLWDRESISDAKLREVSGFVEEDAPGQEEMNRRIGLKLRDASLAVYGIPSVKAGGIEPEAGVIESGDGTAGTPIPEKQANEVQPGPPEEPTPETVVGSAVAAARITGATHMALLRAREVAGNRIKSRARREDALAAKLEGVPARQAAFVLGREAIRELGLNERALVSGSAALVEEALSAWGITDDQVTGIVGEAVEEHAARTLYDERPPALPPSLVNYIEGLTTA